MVNAPEYIDRYIKLGIDRLIYKLMESGDFDFSDGTLLEIANLSTDYITRLTNIVISENLREIEDFSPVTFK